MSETPEHHAFHRIIIEVPADIDRALLDDLTRRVDDLIDAWQPADREDWDAFVCGHRVPALQGQPDVADWAGARYVTVSLGDYDHGTTEIVNINRAADGAILGIELLEDQHGLPVADRPYECPICQHADPAHPGITRAQWLAHHEWTYRDSQEHGANKTSAGHHADHETEKAFGPQPEAAP